MRSLVVLGVVLVGLVVGGCGEGGGSTTATTSAASITQEQMNGKRLVSTSVHGHELAAGSEISVAFNADSTLSFSGGCNQLSAVYDMVDGVVKLQHGPGSTMMACDPALEAQDAWLAKVLAEGMTLSQTDKGYALTAADGARIELVAGPPGPSQRTVHDADWVLRSYGNAGGTDITLVKPGVDSPTLRFDAAGTFTLFTGCNHGGGQFSVRDDGFITFAKVFTTRVHCAGEAGTLERHVLRVLDGKAAFGWSGEGDLSLAKAGDHLLYGAK